MRPRLLPFLAAVLLSSISLAQDLKETVDVTVVEVPVTVHERGSAVRGLTAQNFELLVDGKKVPVEYFEMVDLTKVTAGATDLPAAAHRNFVLLFDVAESAPGTVARAQEAARRFVTTQLRDLDLAAVATYSAAGGAQMLTSFTRDQELLLGAIASLGEAEYFKTADPLRLSAIHLRPLGTALVTSAKDATRLEMAQERGDLARGAYLSENRQAQERAGVAHDNEMRSRVRAQIQSFGDLAAALDRVRGQKQIILLSEGFDARLITGREDLSVKGTKDENDAVLVGEIWRVDDDQRFGSARGAGEMAAMAEIFRRADVRLHAIDIKGLRGNVDAAEGVQRQSNEALFVLTRPTGGTVFRNDNNLSAQFAQLLRQQEVVYVLGFRPKGGKPGQFHSIRVKLAGAKGEVTHRSGYYDQRSGMTDVEAALRLSEMLLTRTDINDLPLSIAAMPVPGEEGDARVPVVIDASGAQLLAGVTAPAANANLFVYAFDAKGKVADFLQQRISLDLAKAGEVVRATGVRYIGSLLLPPGRYTVKALARVDETGRIGLTTATVDVPEYGAKAVLPPVAMREIGRWATVISPGTGAEATELLTLGERRFVPSRRAEMAAGAEHDIALLLRGVDTGNLAVKPKLVAADGSPRAVSLQLAGRTEPDAAGVSKLLFRLASRDLPAGEYELRLDVAGSVVALPVVIR